MKYRALDIEKLFSLVKESTVEQLNEELIGTLYKKIKQAKNSDLTNCEGVYNLLKKKLQGLKQEKVIVVAVNSSLEVIAYKTIFIGTLNKSIIHSRDIFKYAIEQSANSIFLVHNHPSQDYPYPSSEDISTTERIIKSGKIIGIELIDHVIIGEEFYCSIREKQSNMWN